MEQVTEQPEVATAPDPDVGWDGRFDAKADEDPNPLQSDDTTGDNLHLGDDPGPEAPADPGYDPDEIPNPAYLEGSMQLSFDVGGEKPTSSTVTIRGGKVDLGNKAYRKGEIVKCTVELRVDEITFADQHDSATGQVVATRRGHTAKIVALREVQA